jgi:predicted nucleic acid-binding Zn ribbon protein
LITEAPSPLKKSNQQTLKQALDHLVDAFGMREKMDELDITTQWDKVVGPMVARHTVAVRLNKGRLIVKVDSAPLRQELTYMREALREVLNHRAGRPVVKEIVLD